ncbi:uncharacterized protein A1O9_03349 [Exophiala aquamarina CBS 119918]|uniref:COP9 signalosome complex subunit 6 n=1 Tax=Exophiala aquamarina CBS 119918 TaxID=1182545 RepID=A0A072PNZ3_9EURO|nr:uncharacterized protein A1O9_03349 [Exophiala aquamarina CBS 119918]KEF61779.1 hypothetical protein A1O9_03349 [Exophiala aquamarina CBS 119918]
MTDSAENPLLSSKPSDTGLFVSLHPLVLLTVSDHVTRQSVRRQKGPIAGALLGQQKGREITAEYAFPANLVQNAEGQWLFNAAWMEERVQQYRDVHKAPALDFVGWYTLFPEFGPSPAIVALQRQAITFLNDSAILLALHPEAIAQASTVNARLPVSIYEGLDEVEHQKDEASMQVDGEESALSEIKFRSVPYTIETDETEMIAIDYVAKGAGSAAAVADTISDTTAEVPSPPSPTEPVIDKKGKKRADTPSTPAATSSSETEQKATNGTPEIVNPLMPEEEDQIASITTRLNSVRMLQTRISLLREFIQSLPPSYLLDQTSSVAPDPSHLPHLRNIQALLTRLSLLTPVSSSSAMEPLAAASRAQSNNVALASMLSVLGQDIQALSELGRKFSIVESHRNSKAGKIGAAGGGGGGGPGSLGSKNGGGGASGFGGLDEGDGRFGGLAGLAGSGPGRALLA